MSCYHKDHHMQHHLGVAPPGGNQPGLSGDWDVTSTSGYCLSALGSLALPFILVVVPMITGGRWSSRHHTGKGKEQKKDKNSLETPLATFCLHPSHLALLCAQDASNDHFFLTRHHAASNNQGTCARE